MAITWKDPVINGLHRFSKRHHISHISRQGLIDEELPQIILETSAIGETPWQTLSRILQELRSEKIIEFLGNGNYLLLESSIMLRMRICLMKHLTWLSSITSLL
jgi:hypothetical protein